ncbi:MAG: hypothetical protein IT450_11235 [Phycisphaerales bacterium]|nr:hypothetical protein [Phycisphaerales bacterium]
MTRRFVLLAFGGGLGLVAAAQPACPPDWCAVGGPFGDSASVHSLAVFDAGDGPKLYAGGEFVEVAGQPAENLAVWDGERWTPIRTGATARVHVLKVLDDGSGPMLYLGGAAYAGTGWAPFLAAFDGTTWTQIAGFERDPDLPGWTSIRDIEVFDSGGGPELIVGGFFRTVSQPVVRAIARRTENGFVSLGTGLVATGPPRQTALGVGALQVFNDGTGTALYVGGSFWAAGGHSARNVARWDGQDWSAVGAGLTESLPDWYVPTVTALTPWFDDDGPVLLAAGDFAIGAQHGIASWRGAQWTADFGDFLPNGVACLRSLDLGGGPTLFAGGHFDSIDGQPAPLLAYRQGDAWEPIGFDLVRNDRSVRSLATFDDGRGPALFVGGWGFGHTDAPWRSVPIARYGVIRGDLDCDGAVSLTDLAILLSAFGSSSAGDLNGDGETSLEDLEIMLSNFGNDCEA